jgi:hypothetical protein
MKRALALLLALAGVSFAQELRKVPPSAPNQQDQNEAPGEIRRLESVTWDVVGHKLVWVVQTGSAVNGKFVADSTKRYEISPDDATMSFSDEKRGFTRDEATSLHQLLDVLSLYCAESVVWWDDGRGTPVDPNAKPSDQPQRSRPDSNEPSPRKVERPQQSRPLAGAPIALARQINVQP